MMKNNTFEEIAKALEKGEEIGVFPHIHPDGDALGSSFALVLALRQIGKKAYIILDEDIPNNFKFLLTQVDIVKPRWNPEKNSIGVLLDCGSFDRIGKREEEFKKADFSICVDHHPTSQGLCNLNYIDPKAAATGQLVFYIINLLDIKPCEELANCIFTALNTDTGSFQYSNTTKEVHFIVETLYDWGLVPNRVCLEIYENNSINKLKLENKVLNTLWSEKEDRILFAYVSQEMLRETGATMDEADSVVPKLRSIGTCELAVFFKELSESSVKVSLRSKKFIDVTEIASHFGGGGHKRAAGFTISLPLESAIEVVSKYLIEVVNFDS